jgi:citronellol/citronellal dehydrogenase
VTTAGLRADLLAGERIALVGGDDELAGTLAGLGAELERIALEDATEDEPMTVRAQAIAAGAPLATIVIDAAGGGPLGSPLRDGVDATWIALRALVADCFLAPGRGGKAVLVCPRPGAGAHAAAAAAALENLARTTSIEWARADVRVTAVAPSDNAAPDDIAALVAYLCSPGGDYFSGARLALGAR